MKSKRIMSLLLLFFLSASLNSFRMGTVADVEVGDYIYLRSSDMWTTHVMLYKF
jgi:hypothetical protein